MFDVYLNCGSGEGEGGALSCGFYERVTVPCAVKVAVVVAMIPETLHSQTEHVLHSVSFRIYPS